MSTGGKPIENLRIDLAGANEHYSDFGSEKWQNSRPLRFTPEVPCRHGQQWLRTDPGEEYFSSTNVGPTRDGVLRRTPRGKLSGSEWSACRKVEELQLGVVRDPASAEPDGILYQMT